MTSLKWNEYFYYVPLCFIYSSKFSRFLEIGRLRFSVLCPEERCRNCSRVTRGWIIDQPSKCKEVETWYECLFKLHNACKCCLLNIFWTNNVVHVIDLTQVTAFIYFCYHCFNITMFTLQKEGQTALHIAAYEGDESMVKLLSTSNKLLADLRDNVSAGIFL